MPYFAVVPVSNEGFAILVRTKTAISGASAFIQPFTVSDGHGSALCWGVGGWAGLV
jgi:hypothetical protein